MKLLKKVFLGLLIASCCFGIYLATCWALGDMYAYKVRYSIEQWESSETIPELPVIDLVLQDADKALFWEGANPEYSELKARALYYKALKYGSSSDAFVSLITQSKELHLIAINLRPRWPYSWANLALKKAHLNELDDEFNQALNNAVRFGPWESSVHLTVTHAGLISWARLSREQKTLVAENVHRSLVYSFNETRTLLEAYQKRLIICAYLVRDERYQKLCKTR